MKHLRRVVHALFSSEDSEPLKGAQGLNYSPTVRYEPPVGPQLQNHDIYPAPDQQPSQYPSPTFFVPQPSAGPPHQPVFVVL